MTTNLLFDVPSWNLANFVVEKKTPAKPINNNEKRRHVDAPFPKHEDGRHPRKKQKTSDHGVKKQRLAETLPLVEQASKEKRKRKEKASKDTAKSPNANSHVEFENDAFKSEKAAQKFSIKENRKLKRGLDRGNAAEAKLKPLLDIARKGSVNTKSETSKQPEPTLVQESTPFSKKAKLTPLQERMRAKLSGARFRWINEQLYTTSSATAISLFKESPEMFDEYHEGFRSQVTSWPKNPVDHYIAYLLSKPKSTVIADLGCGDAKIAEELVPKDFKVFSFDLVARNTNVTECDIAKVPLSACFVDIAIYCLALMGTNYVDFLREAHRILKPRGELKIAEVVSRFSDVDSFIAVLEELGFRFVSKDDSNKMFILFDFVKIDTPNSKPAGKGKLTRKASELLKPCVYKKR